MAVELNYTALDRLLHRVAFAGPAVQLAAADMEHALFGAVYRDVNGSRPIFVTSLPRAGTTLMLEMLYRLPSLASHVYRDMPFVMAPLVWARMSSSFRKQEELRERAHGDGLEIGFDSPEAFEEILWRAFWPEKYHETRIDLWGADDQKPEAQAFFHEHVKKIIALRRPGRLADGRYVSKNNANVARLDLLGSMFPAARIVVPLRDPLDHARSLLSQHRRFLDMHREEPFVRRYMGDIGHYEFGSLHRPIAFPGAAALMAGRDPLGIDYWLAYWIAAFEHVEAHRESVILVSYEACCRHPRETLSALLARLDVPDEGALADATALVRDQPPSSRGRIQADADLLIRARALHATLLAAH